jgi:hypothetical protein
MGELAEGGSHEARNSGFLSVLGDDSMTELNGSKEELARILREALAEDRKAIQDAEASKEGGIPWNIIYKVSQIAVFPALAVIFYMLTQLGNLDRRVTITELVQAGRPNFTSIAEKTAVLEERQKVNINRIEVLEKGFEEHRAKSTYDSPRGRNK